MLDVNEHKHVKLKKVECFYINFRKVLFTELI